MLTVRMTTITPESVSLNHVKRQHFGADESRYQRVEFFSSVNGKLRRLFLSVKLSSLLQMRFHPTSTQTTTTAQ